MINLAALEGITQKYYPFSYILLPEELMATQLLIDAATKVCVNSLQVISASELENAFVSAVYELACMRQKHFNLSPESDFFRLTIEQRAVVYLKDQKDWSIEEIAGALGLRWDRLYSALNLGRNHLVDMTAQASNKLESGL